MTEHHEPDVELPSEVGPAVETGREQLEMLIEGYILDTLDEDGGRRLNAVLGSSRAARDVFRDRLRFHQLCYEAFTDDTDPLLATVTGAARAAAAGRGPFGWPGLLPLATGLALALVVAVGAVLAVTGGPVGERSPVARVITSDTLPLGPLSQGRIAVPNGFAEIEMANGARFAVEAGGVVELLAADRVRLIRGELGADVPPEARGFTVVTDDGEIVDWGTRFGVSVLPSRPTTAMVFSGEIEVVTTRQSRRVQNRQAVVLGENGTMAACDTAVDEGGFPMPARVEVIPLVLGDFESPEDYAVQGGERAGQASWVGDLCQIVGPRDGVRPAHGGGMLQLLAASADGEASQQNFCNVGQQIELTPADLAGAEIEVSMQVNRLAVPEDIDTLFKLSVVDVSDRVLSMRSDGKTLLTAFVLSDADQDSWETVAVRGELPPGVRRLKVIIGAQENIWNNDVGEAIEFDGHFIDEVQARLVLPARRSLF